MRVPTLIACVNSVAIILFFLMDRFYGAIFTVGIVCGMYFMDELIKDKQRRLTKHKRKVDKK